MHEAPGAVQEIEGKLIVEVEMEVEGGWNTQIWGQR